MVLLAVTMSCGVQSRLQGRERNRRDRPMPTFAEVAYGEHERHVLDFWQADSEKPMPVFVWIHGGGFRGGNKSSIPATLLEPFLQAGVSCASIHYRLSQHAPYPAQMHDSARAIQFIRSKADKWNINPTLMAAMDKLGIACVRKLDSDYGSMTEAYTDMVRFVTKNFHQRQSGQKGADGDAGSD
ncbi:MAG: alpha/beta hydrolase [Sedimentisphaerales bacterium]|nr:alpha/beta hydrolase [Sedimentisphaerales bacterium]